MTLTNEIVNEILLDSKKKLTTIFIIQSIVLLIVLLMLFLLNIDVLKFIPKNLISIVNSSLFGFTGSLIYFSRKSYVYLITSKFKKIIDEYDEIEPGGINYTKNTIRGYYLYLLFRPFVGLVIGPILYMLSITGLITLIKGSLNENQMISQSGRYFIYILSFLGGHSSSDILDKFSKFANHIGLKKNYNDD